MNLRTTFNVPTFPNKISHQSKMVALGSCFATMLGRRLEERKYDLLVNPFGTIFNPISLFSLIQNSIIECQPNHKEIISYQDRFIHYGYHSSISADTKEELLSQIKDIHLITGKYLKEATHLFITLGTAHVYEHNDLQQLVANCHKQPSAHFTKRLLSLLEMEASFDKLYQQLIQFNPQLNIILTVSPVRHTKDGVPENQLSKSLLRVFVNQLVQRFENVHYFPSYELMMDDLRDYRFYKEDLIHPTEQAENYIYDKFEEAFIGEENKMLDKRIIDINRSLLHKPFNPKTVAHQKFLNNLVAKIEDLPPYLNFGPELKIIKMQMTEN